MTWVIGVLLVVLGLTMVIAGTEGNGPGALFTTLTGKAKPAAGSAPAASSTPPAAPAAQQPGVSWASVAG